MARRITVEATAYGPPWNAMEGTGITSTGVNLRKGQQKLVVAVDPRVIPYGTKLRIPNNPFGNPNLIFTAADTGGAIKGNRLDFFVASGRNAQNGWGRRNTTIEIVGKGSPKDVAVLGHDKPSTTAVATTTTRQVGPDYKSIARRQAAAQWLLSGGRDPVQAAQAVNAAEDSAPARQTVTETTTTPGTPQGGGWVDRVRTRADAIDKQRLPYVWGGGHAGQTPLHKAVPLDCSGAVSKALGIDPRVSGQFSTWGRPGRAPNGRGVTIYANGKHVLMEINGKFWGTSGSNPGGGAGWIPRSQITPSYLSGFTVRHSARR